VYTYLADKMGRSLQDHQNLLVVELIQGNLQLRRADR
jgi:hypothetical protein